MPDEKPEVYYSIRARTGDELIKERADTVRDVLFKIRDLLKSGDHVRIRISTRQSVPKVQISPEERKKAREARKALKVVSTPKEDGNPEYYAFVQDGQVIIIKEATDGG